MTGDQAGTTVLDKVVAGGGDVSVSFAIKELGLRNLKRVLVNSGSVTKVTTKEAFEITPKAGLSLYGIANQLTIKPFVAGAESANANDWITAEKAAPSPETVSMAFGNTDQRKVAAKFICFPNASKSNKRQLVFGDVTAIA